MALHIGKIIKKRIEEAGMNKSEFARRINSTPQNIYSIFRRTSIDTDLLWEISRVLNYDFFQHYTTTPGMNTNSDHLIAFRAAPELSKELALVRRETELAAQENRYLKELVQLLRGKTNDQFSIALNTPYTPAPPSYKAKQSLTTNAYKSNHTLTTKKSKTPKVSKQKSSTKTRKKSASR